MTDWYHPLIKLAYGHNYKLTVITPDRSYLVQIKATKIGSQNGYQRAAIPIAYSIYKQYWWPKITKQQISIIDYQNQLLIIIIIRVSVPLPVTGYWQDFLK